MEPQRLGRPSGSSRTKRTRAAHGERPAYVLRHTFTLDEPSARPAATRPPTGSTRSSSTAGESATSSSLPASRATGRTSTSRPTTSPNSSSPATTCGRSCSATAGTGAAPATGRSADGYGDTVAFLGSSRSAARSWRRDRRGGRRPARSAPPTSWPARSRTGGSSPAEWAPVAVVDHDLARLTARRRRRFGVSQELRPVAVTRPRPDRQVVDLGQNINGWVRLARPRTGGDRRHPRPRRGPRPERRRHQDHLDARDDRGRAAVGQVDRVISAGRAGDMFEPRHTTHGFQYVRVEGPPAPARRPTT